jgi:iron(III) transport system substrate-binding protein
MKWLLLCLTTLLAGCASKQDDLVIYTSQDQFYSEPFLREFTEQTGIRVRAVFDTESAKTAGLANRLRAEAGHPQCDLFWSNEELHARVLAAEGVIEPEKLRMAGFRTRRLVLNTNLLSHAQAPADLLSLTNEFWRGKIALAFPLYGTTSAHFLALRQHWGTETWTRWCEGLVANRARVVDGNSLVVKLVGAGEAWIGLSDSDDIAAGQRAGLPVAQAPCGPETLVIPSTIAMVASGQNPAATEFINFLTEHLDRLVEAGAIESAVPPVVNGLRINWSTVQEDLADTTKVLKGIFLRT